MRIEASGFACAVTCASVFAESPEDLKPIGRADDIEGALPTKVLEDNQCSTSSTSTSSIGKNSDLSSERSMEDEDSGENEAQSAYKGPLDMMDSLEEVLPIRRGISKFYNGKSKSFTSLADASSSPSMKDMGKPENAYSRRRRNLMAFNHVYDNRNRTFPLRSNSGGICKRTMMSSSRSALALAVAINNSESSTSEDSTSSSDSRSPWLLPPLHPRHRVSTGSAGPSSPLEKNSAWRSYSLADLHNCATAATMKMSSSSLRNETALNKLT